MIRNMLENVKNASPLVHCITNYVTVNDCANVLLACDGSPIMSDDSDDVEEITSICGSLVINIGTLNSNTIPSMFIAGKKSNQLGHPVILDPVGAGASSLRTKTALELIKAIEFSVIRGNISEIKAILGAGAETKGVDANVDDRITEENLESSIAFVKRIAAERNCVVAITGAIDLVGNSEKVFVIRNGHPMLSKITGSGCMVTAMTGAYICANKANALEATAAAVCAMGLCGELAYEKLLKNDGGNSTYRNLLIDEIYNLTPEKLERGAKYEIK